MDIQTFMEEITAWADKTFPDQPVLGKLSHLRDEVKELQSAVDNGDPQDMADELADCWILLLNISKKIGYTEQGIATAIRTKMAINRNRIWGKKGTEGQIYHINKQL